MDRPPNCPQGSLMTQRSNVGAAVSVGPRRQFLDAYFPIQRFVAQLNAEDLGTAGFIRKRDFHDLVKSPWPDDGFEWLSWAPFSIPFNMTQQPAASVPCGFTRAGLPVGLQIAGRMVDDAGVLAAAWAYQSADPHFDVTPKGFA